MDAGSTPSSGAGHLLAIERYRGGNRGIQSEEFIETGGNSSPAETQRGRRCEEEEEQE
jgi:hypothetical protein